MAQIPAGDLLQLLDIIPEDLAQCFTHLLRDALRDDLVFGLGGLFKLSVEVERLPAGCDDGIDNDRDGMTDCSDSSCIAAGLCGLIIIEGLPPEPENTYEKCIDRIDNDQDGNYDCGDRNCQAIMELCCTTEFSDAACSDGFDNDENGFRDCGDFSCRQSDFVTVCDAETDCDDGRDNDEDGRVDCADTDCSPFGPSGECCDGVDDDGDGFTDVFTCRCFSDADCAGVGDIDQVCYESTFSVCAPRCDFFGGDSFCQMIAPSLRCVRRGPRAGECVP